MDRRAAGARTLRAILGLLLCLGLVAWAPPALAERRVALVFGADAYRAVRPLANAVNDAVAVQDLLAGLGFDPADITLEPDPDLRRMRRALADFTEDAAGADLAVVFFAGHGVEVAGRNLLLPVDAGGATAAEIVASALPLEEVAETLRRVAPAGLVILDACRDDPFGAGDAGARGGGALAGHEAAAVRPMGRVGQADRLLFAFAAAPGAAASDGAGRNSPFTEAMLRHFATPGLEVRSALTLVQQDVYDRTRGAQLPYIEAALPAPVFLAPDADDLPERTRLLLAMAGIDADLRARVERIAAERDMPLAPLYASALEGGLAELSAEAREARLAEAADAFVDTRERLRTLEANDARVQALWLEARRLLDLGERLAALDAMGRARAIASAAVDASTAVAVDRYLSEAATLTITAGIHETAFAYAEALAGHAESADLYARVAALAMADGRPPPPAALDGETLALWRLVDLHWANGDPSAALAAYRRWQAAAETRLASAVDDMLWQFGLSRGLDRISDVLRGEGSLPSPALAYRARHAVAERLVALWPDSLKGQLDLVASHSRLALVGDDPRGNLGAGLAILRSLQTEERLPAATAGWIGWFEDQLAALPED